MYQWHGEVADGMYQWHGEVAVQQVACGAKRYAGRKGTLDL